MFQFDDEAEEITKAEEFEPKGAEELVSGEAWVHRLPHIKMQGRCTVWKPEAEVRRIGMQGCCTVRGPEAGARLGAGATIEGESESSCHSREQAPLALPGHHAPRN